MLYLPQVSVACSSLRLKILLVPHISRVLHFMSWDGASHIPIIKTCIAAFPSPSQPPRLIQPSLATFLSISWKVILVISSRLARYEFMLLVPVRCLMSGILQVKTVKIIRDREGKPKGFGYVEFVDLDGLKDGLSKTDSVRYRPPISSLRDVQHISTELHGTHDSHQCGRTPYVPTHNTKISQCLISCFFIATAVLLSSFSISSHQMILNCFNSMTHPIHILHTAYTLHPISLVLN